MTAVIPIEKMQFKYPEAEIKPGYKHTALGWIPEEWEVDQLKNVCIKIQDGNYGAEYPTSEQFTDKGVAFLTSKAIGKDGNLIADKIDFISPEKHNQLKKAHLWLNDILFTNRGVNVGAIGIVDESIADGNIGPQLTLLRSDETKIFHLYLREVMQCEVVQNQIKTQDTGSAMNFFGIGDTSKFKIPLPTLPEQKSIAAILSTWNKTIKKLQQLITQKELLKKVLMQQLLTGKKRLKGFEKEKWKEVRLDDVTEIDELSLSNQTPDDYSFQYLSLSDVDSSSSEIKSERIIFSGAPSRARRIIRKGDVLLSTVRPNLQGFIIIRDEVKDLIASTGFAVITCTKINNEFLFQYLFTRNLMKQIESFLVGSNYPAINSSDVKHLKIPYPSIEEQSAIAKLLQVAEKEISLLNKKLEALKEQKKGLMQVLLTGKVRVKNHLS